MPVVEVRNLSITLPRGGDRVMAVEDVSFSISEGEIVCIVGESGSGKSVVAQAIMGLLPGQLKVRTGKILFGTTDLVSAGARAMRAVRGSQIGMIFQEPMTALNPVYKVGAQIDEVLRTHLPLSAAQRFARVIGAMDEVGLPDPDHLYHAYPHQLSGGQRQRVLIAAALILQPRLLIADEPTTALDVTTQAQILHQILRLQRARHMGVLFITHDFGVVAEIADRVIVARSGKIVEAGTRYQILHEPKSEYTRALVAAVPSIAPTRRPYAGADVVLQARAISKDYRSRRGTPALVATDVTVRRGETVGVIGESGSGKSTLARCLTGIIQPSTGSVSLTSEDNPLARRTFKQRVQIVFQDPYRSLNPRRTIGQSIVEGPMNFGVKKVDAWSRARTLITRVGLDVRMLDRFPHQFSGGQRQRVCIARALAMEPDVLIADEAVSALDVTVQAQVLKLLSHVQAEMNLAILFITHDLRVAAQICDRIMVMHRGHVVEEGAVAEIYSAPRHEYTKSLFASVPGVRSRPSSIENSGRSKGATDVA